MKELGKILREKRESLGLDLDKVHRATKIQEKYILAIEDGDESVFSAEIYYKSFVKSYAKFLALSGEELLSMYEKRKSEKDEAAENEQTENVGKKQQHKTKSSSGGNNDLKKLFVTVLIAGVLCAAFLYMNKHIPILDSGSDRMTALEQKKARLQQLQELQEQREIEAAERRMQEAAAAEEKSKIDEPGNKILKPFPQKSNTPAPAAAVTEANQQTAASGGNSASSENSSAALKSQPEKQELVIDAVENVWIMVEGDGKEVFQGTMIKGTKKSWKANDEFVVKIGYTPGVAVFFNGAAIDVDKDAVQDVNTLVLKRQR